jgi:hypothetical protein
MSVRDDIRAGKYRPDEKFGNGQGKESTTDRTKRRTEERRLVLVFKADSMAELGLAGIPAAKQDKAWEMAWDRGHASGLEEVLNELEELAELLA